MAVDLTIFQQTLEPAQEPGLESVDPRLAVLDELAGKEDHTTLVERIEELLGARLYDIRPISYYLHEAFIERGPAALPDILTAAQGIVGPNAETIGPARKRQEHFDRRFAWLFEKLNDTLVYHEKKQTPEWAAWNTGLGAEDFAAAFDAAQQLAEMIQASGYARTAPRLARLVGWLRDRKQQADSQKAQEEAAVAATAPEDTEAAAAPAPHPVARSPFQVELTVSHRFLDLRKKLTAFETLIENGQYEKAALVSDDILELLERFDPREYFPEMFARFSALYSKNIRSIAGHWDQRESPEWRALQQFYRVDLEGFLGSDGVSRGPRGA